MGKSASTLQHAEAAEQETSGADARDIDLEAGIASIFAAIRSGSGGEETGEVPEDSGATYDLLARLDQLWQAVESGDA